MTASASDVAVVLRERLPGLHGAKLHKYLYYAQGHHLAMLGQSLFPETISAWDDGPVVTALWRHETDTAGDPARLTNSELTTVEYVLSRYGQLTGKDLENLTKAETPWRTADAVRRPGESIVIRHDWLRDYFSTDGNPVAGEDQVPLDASVIAAALADADRVYEEHYRQDESEGAGGPVAGRRGA